MKKNVKRSYLVTLILSSACSLYAQDSLVNAVRQIHKEYYTTVSELISSHPINRYSLNQEDFDANDTAHIKFPRDIVIENLSCWSSADSDPKCSSQILLNQHAISLDSIYGHWSDVLASYKGSTADDRMRFSKAHWEAVDSSLRYLFINNTNELNSISLIKNERTDRLWGVMKGIGVSPIFVLSSMLGELVDSEINHSKYNWTYVGVSSFVLISVYTSYSILTVNVDPIETRVVISIKKEL